MEDKQLIIPERIETGITDINQRALTLKITDNSTYKEAGQLFTLIGDMEREIKAFLDPHVDRAHKTWKALTASRKEEIEKLLPGKNHLNREMVAYRNELNRKAEEEARKQREEQKKREEEERLKMAEQAEKEGEKEVAESIISEPIIETPVKPVETPKPEGVQFRTTYDFEIVAVDLIPRKYMIPDKVAIRKIVNAMKEKTDIPGIKLIRNTSAGRGRSAGA